MKKNIQHFIISASLFLFGTSIGFACTDIRLTAQDGTVLIARSMEFAIDTQSNIVSSPRGREFSTQTINQKPGLTWKAKYGYLLVDGFGAGVTLDGMNEEGLSFEALFFPTEAEYQTIPEGKDSQALPYYSIGDWVLGNFKTVDEVKASLPNIYVYGQALPQLKDLILPAHFSIYDASGKGIVVEYVKGELNVYDNQIGVMTNSPAYDWHMTNLRNYINLSPVTPKPIIDNGMTFAATGQGAGMLGLPGDISPPSRFVKMAVMLKTIIQPKDAAEALNMAQHVINNVDIPLGFVREAQAENTATNELTQWVVFKDLTHKKLYYRTYADTSIRMIDMEKIDFSPHAKQFKMSVASDEQHIIDMTTQFAKK